MSDKKSEKAKKSKKPFIIIGVVVFTTLVLGLVATKVIIDGLKQGEDFVGKVAIEAEYKNTDGAMIEVEKESDDPVKYTEDLIKSNKEFVMLISTPACSEETARFRDFVKKYQKDHKISFYYLTSDYAQESSINDTIKYFPTVAIFKDGKIVKFLRFDSDDDMKYYKSYDGFAKWFEKYVEL